MADPNLSGSNPVQGMEGGAVTFNGSPHHHQLDRDDEDLMASNGMDDVMKPTTSSGMEGADPMTMSGLFSARDLDPHSEGTETSTSASTQGGGGGDTFGGCGMTDSFILQRDDDYGDSSQSSEQPGDMLGGCGMTDSFMQLTNGATMTGMEATPQQRQQQEEQGGDAVLIDFGQPMGSQSAAQDVLAEEQRGLDSQAALFGEDLGHSQEALNAGYAFTGREPAEQQQQQRYHDDMEESASDGYHPGQPAAQVTTNPFAMEEPFQTEPTPPCHTAVPAGIDLLIQSAPPPSHPPYPEEERGGSSYNPFMAEGEEERAARQYSDSIPADTSSDTNPFALPPSAHHTTTAEPSRLGGQAGESHSYDLFGGRGAGEREEEEEEEEEEERRGTAFQVTPHHDTQHRAAVETEREMDTDVVSAPAAFSHAERDGYVDDEEDFSALRDDVPASEMPRDSSSERQPEPAHDYLAELEMSAAPGAPRGTEDTSPFSQTPAQPEEPMRGVEPGELQQEAAVSVETHARLETASVTLEPEVEPQREPEPSPEPAPPQPQEEPPKPVATVVPQPASAPTHIPQPASPKQIKPAADSKAKAVEKAAPKSPRKTPASPSKSGVPVKTTTTTTTSASRQRPASASLTSTSGSRPTSARAAPKKEEAKTTPTSRPRTAPSARPSKDANRGSQTAGRANGTKSDVSKSAGKSPTTRTTAKPTPSKPLTTPKGTAGPRGAAAGGGTTPRTPTTGASSPASSASGSTSSARKAEVRSKIGSLDNATHTPGGGNVKIVSKKPDVSSVQSRIGSKDKIDHKPGGGNVKIETKKVEVSTVKSRVGSLDNAKHTPRGGDKKIESKKLDWKVQSRVGSLDNAKHVAGGGTKRIEQHKLEWKAQSKVGSMDNATHTPGGGDKKILNEKLKWEVDSRIGSLDNAQHVPGGGKKKVKW